MKTFTPDTEPLTEEERKKIERRAQEKYEEVFHETKSRKKAQCAWMEVMRENIEQAAEP